MPIAFINKIIQRLILLFIVLVFTIVFTGGFNFFTIVGILFSLFLCYEIYLIASCYSKQNYDVVYGTCIELEKSGYRNQYNKGTFEHKDGQFYMITTKKDRLYLNAKYVFYVKKNTSQITQTNIIAWNRSDNVPEENLGGIEWLKE